jgi:hypothetical protein
MDQEEAGAGIQDSTLEESYLLTVTLKALQELVTETFWVRRGGGSRDLGQQ